MTQDEFLERILMESNKQLGNGVLTKRQVGIVTRSVFDQITEALYDEGSFTRVGFGTFKIKDRAAKKGRNPQTGQAIDIPAGKAIGFKAGAGLKKAVTS